MKSYLKHKNSFKNFKKNIDLHIKLLPSNIYIYIYIYNNYYYNNKKR